jgi:hypothetical protein
MGVPQIVEPERGYALGRESGHQLPPHMGVEVAVVQRSAAPTGEDEVVSRSAIDPSP